MGNSKVIITNKTKGKLPGLPFSRMKDTVLGNGYELSLVFIGNARSKELNSKWRGKNYPTDILSFSLDDNSGEIFINPKAAEKKAAKFERTPENYLAFLFIHGLFHLKGLDHGSTMEHEEKKVRTLFRV